MELLSYFCFYITIDNSVNFLFSTATTDGDADKMNDKFVYIYKAWDNII